MLQSSIMCYLFFSLLTFRLSFSFFFFFFNDTATTEIYTLSLHALFRSTSPGSVLPKRRNSPRSPTFSASAGRSEEHTSELQSQSNLVCRLLLEKKKKHNERQPN